MFLYLRAAEVHAPALSEGVSEVACRTGDPVLSQVLLQACSLGVRIVLLFPPGKILTRDSVMLSFPGDQALSTGHGPAVRADQLLVLRIC